MTGLTDDIKAVLEPVVARARVDMGPLLWQQLRQATYDVYRICEDEEKEAQVLVDEFNKLQDEMEDK